MTFDEDSKAYGDVSSIADEDRADMDRAGGEGSANFDSQMSPDKDDDYISSAIIKTDRPD